MLIASGSNFKFLLSSHVGFPLLAIILRLIPITADFSYLIIAGYALLGRRQIIEALLLSWFFSMLSPEIVPFAEYESFFRYSCVQLWSVGQSDPNLGTTVPPHCKSIRKILNANSVGLSR